jgi:ADP-ribose diphosphatase
MIRPWPTISSREIGDFRVFKLRTDNKVSPRTGQTIEVYILDSANWVNVIAVTPNQELILVEQYRFGTDTIELEIPGGVMDAVDASPVATGVRELREETGYEGENPQIIGKIFANPAILSNTCYTVMVENCELKHAVEFDHGEDLMTHLVPVREIPGLVAAGKIRHSLVVVALYYFELWRRHGGKISCSA